ncbi:phosphoenolpyruvate synthase, partial [Pseudomonas caspiana]
MTGNISWFKELGLGDVDSVGGKNASLGEMVQHLSKAGVRVPDGFATTADAYRRFLAHEGLADRISATLADLDVEDTRSLAEAGAQIRDLVEGQPFPADLDTDIRAAYDQLVADTPGEVSWAVRSSATAEDMPDASFAGQQETFLNVT